MQHEQDWRLADEMTFAPLTRDTWIDFTQLFGERGACANCWCMYFRLAPKDFVAGKSGGGNKESMKELVWSGKPTGILGYHQGKAIGWCAFAPREDFSKMERSRVHKRIDDLPVWSVTCFFIDKAYRRAGASVAMLEGVKKYAREQGIATIEAYPTIPTKTPLPDSFGWIGLFRSFEEAGFYIADQTSKYRPMMRYDVDSFEKQGE